MSFALLLHICAWIGFEFNDVSQTDQSDIRMNQSASETISCQVSQRAGKGGRKSCSNVISFRLPSENH